MQQKRRELQESNSQRERTAYLRAEIDLLDSHAVAYELLYDTEPYYRWIGRNFKATGEVGRIDWTEVPETRFLPETADPGEWLKEIAGQLLPAQEVVIVWSNGNRPGLLLNLEDLLAHCEVVTLSFESWVFCPMDTWLLQYTCDFGWEWGRAGDRPQL